MDWNFWWFSEIGAGNKWIGTGNGGLAKFDGTNWTVYNTSNSGLPDNSVWSIVLDGAGNKWIGTNGGGLAKFDGTNWIVYDTSNSGLPHNQVMSLAIDGAGNKWIGTKWDGLAKFDGTSWTVYYTSNSGLPSYSVWSIVIDGAGNKWIGTEGGVAVYTGGSGIKENPEVIKQNIKLVQNYPNPFTGIAEIRYGLSKDANVNIIVYNLLGQRIATIVNEQHKKAGYYTAKWDARALISGIYFIKLKVDSFEQTKKIILVR
jgi:ligand-binding sensor domain-containing protein